MRAQPTALVPRDLSGTRRRISHVVAVTPPAHVIVLPGGAAEDQFTLRRPAGVVLLFRVTVPHGARVVVDGRIEIAGVRLSTRSASCTRRAAGDVCVQPEEWCPIPAAVWRFTVRKLEGDSGPIRIDFVVAPAPN